MGGMQFCRGDQALDDSKANTSPMHHGSTRHHDAHVIDETIMSKHSMIRHLAAQRSLPHLCLLDEKQAATKAT